MPKVKSKKNSIDKSEKICRVCAKALSKHFPMVKVDDDIKVGISNGCTFKVAHELSLLNIKIDKNDGLPQEACIHCVGKISKIYSFRKLCELSQIKLRQIFDPLNTLTLTDILKSEVEDEEFILHNENCVSPLPSPKKDATSENSSNVELSTSKYENRQPQATTSKSALNEVILFDCSNTSQFIPEKDDYSMDSNEEAEMDVDTNSDNDPDYSFKENKNNSKKPEDIKPRHEQNVTNLDTNTMSESDSPLLSESDDSKANEQKRADQNVVKQIELNKEIESKCYESMDYSNLIDKEDRFEDEEEKKYHNLIHNNEKHIQCSICNTNFTSNYDFVEHVKMHTGDDHLIQKNEIVLCNICCKYKLLTRFKKDRLRCDQFEKNYRVPLSDKEFCCYYCNKMYDDKSKLHEHILKTHSIENPFNCIECDAKFQNVNCRINHYIKCHKNIEAYDCPICDTKFIDRQMSLKHRIQYHTPNVHECIICSKRFHNIEKLQNHKLNHETDLPLKCKFCDRSFKQNQHLREHEKVHLDERPYKCKTCGKRFRAEFTYEVHLRLHTGENFSICEFCGENFTEKSLLSIHLKNAHNDGYMYMCEYCGENFKELNSLNQHKKSHGDTCEIIKTPKKLVKRYRHWHEISFTCPVCKKLIYTPLGLQRHLKLHDKTRKYKCPECPFSYGSSWALGSHSKRMHPKEGVFSCYCGKTFSSPEERDEHKKIHTKNGKTIKCFYCDETFSSKCSRILHQREVHTGERSFYCLICGESFISTTKLRMHTRRAHSVEENRRIEEQILAEVANKISKDV